MVLNCDFLVFRGSLKGLFIKEKYLLKNFYFKSNCIVFILNVIL